MSASLPLDRQGPGWRGGLAGIVLAILLGAVAYLVTSAWPRLFPPPLFEAASQPGCDLHSGPCAAAFDATRFIRLQIEPKTLPASEPLRVLVDTAGFPVATATIEFSGVDMQMGLVRHDLIDSGVGSFSGDAILPVCVRRRMTWRAIVTTRGADGLHRATFDFEVGRP